MLFLATSCALGLVVGSFLNVVIHRVPRGTFLSGGKRSHCPHCGELILWHDNIPVVSWLILRGKARCCAKPIAWRYPLVELLTGIVFLLIALRHEPQVFRADKLQLRAAFLMAADFYLVGSLLAAAAIDIEHRILPDAINFLGIGVGFAVSLFLPELHADSWFGQYAPGVGPEGLALLTASSGCALGAASLYLIAVIGRAVYRTEAMGLGDVKFMAFAGTFIGPDGVLLALLVGCVLGAVLGLMATLRTGDPHVAFGPFLAVGIVVARFFKAPTTRLLFEEWPAWLHANPGLALPLLIGLSGVCLFILFMLRRRRRASAASHEESAQNDHK